MEIEELMGTKRTKKDVVAVLFITVVVLNALFAVTNLTDHNVVEDVFVALALLCMALYAATKVSTRPFFQKYYPVLWLLYLPSLVYVIWFNLS